MQLPFAVEPRPSFQEIGSDESGKLRFSQQRSIALAERIAVKEVDRSDELFEALAKETDSLHKEANRQRNEGQETAFALTCSKSLADAYFALLDAIALIEHGGIPKGDSAAVEIALRHREAVRELAMQKAQTTDALIIRKATVMIQRRLPNCGDWTDADTEALDSEALVLEIAMFFDQELSGMDALDGIQQKRDALEALQEALGKLLPATGSEPPTPTGESSTGDAPVPTPDETSSDLIASETCPSPTSSTPSLPPGSES
jgi:hypothetical protein